MKWLFLVHQVQTPSSRERVKVWRLTKKVGALLYRNSVYVLPYTKERLEDFQWLCQEIRDSKGEASVFVSEAKDATEDRLLRQQFMNNREQEYAALQRRMKSWAERYDHASTSTPLTPERLKRAEHELRQIEESYADIKRIDFFEQPLGSRMADALPHMRSHISKAEVQPGVLTNALKKRSRNEFRNKLWVTRPHIHIDRLCSAWLIKRFIDPSARFTFAPENKLPEHAIPFDIFGAEFSHQGDRCTFETLLEVFRIKDKGLSSLAELVHEIDLKDEKYHRPESPGLDLVVRSLSGSLRDDWKTLEIGSQVLDAVYARFSSGRGA